ncbi:MAG: response regulator [Stellaceae bacterium]
MVRTIIIEDEPMVAMLIEEFLCEEGFEITGRAGSLDEADRLIAACPCDVVVLDVNLHGKSVASLAMALRERGIPFLFITGYGRARLPETFLDAPLLSKPFKAEQLIRAVRQLLPAA